MITSPLCNKRHHLAYFNSLLQWTCVCYCMKTILSITQSNGPVSAVRPKHMLNSCFFLRHVDSLDKVKYVKCLHQQSLMCRISHMTSVPYQDVSQTC